MLQDILSQYALPPGAVTINPFGTGLINHTWKVTIYNEAYILQRINTSVFPSPENIDHNLRLIKEFLTISAPEYLFAGPMSTLSGQTTVKYLNDYYRLQPFVKNSHTVDAINKPGQAYQAAKQFGKFSQVLTNINPAQLKITLPNFHNLSLRVEQFNATLKTANKERLAIASNEIKAIKENNQIAVDFSKLHNQKNLPLRVIHHDTKISNVLFDENDKGLCVIDLDTVMPGYFISDVGDMMRTYLCKATEEEQQLQNVNIRLNVFDEIYQGYLEEMGATLTSQEKNLFIFSGKFMIYMQAIRFLTDYLSNDIYYPIKYPEHNLSRAKNQIALLSHYLQSEPEFKKITG